jgi:predicted ester cyclase
MKHLIKKIFNPCSLLVFTVLILLAGCRQPIPDYSKEIKPVVDKYVAVWNSGKVDELDAVIDTDFIRHAESTSVENLDNLKKLITNTRTAFPDLKLVLSDEIYSENKFAALFSFMATNTGPGQMPPTGKAVKVWGVVIAHFSNGKINEEWVGYDNQSFMEQLGFTMMPPGTK